MRVNRCGSRARLARRVSRTMRYSAESSGEASGTVPVFSNSTPLCTSRVASPPSSRIMLGPSKPSAVQSKMRSARRQYSSRVSPFHANTGTPAGASVVPSGPTTTAAAASSCVEKMLQLAQRTCAPRATSVSISTAVCTVMCSDPAMRAPRSGCEGPNSSRSAMSPGISFSASRSWWRPASASDRSATSNSRGAGSPAVERAASPAVERAERDETVVDIPSFFHGGVERRDASVPWRHRPFEAFAALRGALEVRCAGSRGERPPSPWAPKGGRCGWRRGRERAGCRRHRGGRPPPSGRRSRR